MVQNLLLVALSILLCLGSFSAKAQAPVLDETPVTKSDSSHIITEAQLKVLSWNIYMLPRLVRQVGQLERSKLIAEKLIGADYDVIVFQEAFDKKSRKILWSIIKEIYPYAVGPVNESRNTKRMSITNGGVWIVSKLPLKKMGEILFDDCKGFDCGSRKGALMVQVEKDGHTYQVIGTHMQADDSPKIEAIREKQLEQIKAELVDPYHVDGVPQLLCGDFNIHKRDLKHYNHMLKTLAAENNVCAADLLGDNPAITEDIHTYDCNSNDLVDYEEATTLDYILVKNNNFIFRSIRRKVTLFVANWNNKKFIGRKNLSDHHAVEITLIPGI